MKRRPSPALLLLLTISAFAIAPVQQSLAGQDSWSSSPESGGRLMMKHSVTLGINVALSVIVDGRQAGVFTRGHLFDISLPPGSHVVSVRAHGRLYDEWTGRLNVRRGQTDSYLVKYRANQLVLAPVRPIG